MDTKRIILKTALDLYNTQGVHAITSRHIAAEMGISAGNLHYHFKQTDEIIKTLYGQLAADFDNIISSMESLEDVRPEMLHEAAIRSFELVYKYRFIFLYFVEISMRIPSIRKDYYALTQRRTKEFLFIFEQFKAKGIFRKDLPESLWEGLVQQIFIVGDFWLSNNELTVRLKGSHAVKHYARLFFRMFYPYFTPQVLQNIKE